MSYQFPPDIEALVQQQLELGHFQSPDDVLRAALGQLAAEEEEIRAIQASIDLVDDGDEGLPLDAAFDAIRRKHNLAADA
jgi:Arc/MetJ-type ribon-helix-helix transcriptional regulator